jgi:hypothetical protein
MPKTLYAMQFTGRGEPAGEGLLQAATQSTSTRITSTVGPGGLESELASIEGGAASFSSEVRMTGESSFTETGRIQFGDGHSLTFSTIGEGYIAPSPEDGLLHGSVMWRIESGDGQFEGASGIITSNFTLSADGEVTDNHFGYIWLQ